MLNSYDFQPNSNKQKISQLRIIDYQNCKYQGRVINKVREGGGILLDRNYLLAVAKWQNGRVVGQNLVVYPDQSIFYGTIKSKRSSGLCCFQISKKVKIYSMLGGQKADLFVLDEGKTTSLTLITVSRSTILKVMEQPEANEYILLQQNKKNEASVKIEFIDKIKNVEEKWSTIHKFIGKEVSGQFRSYKQFLNHYFCAKVGSVDQKLQIVQAKQQFQFGFKNTSIKCKIMQKKDNQLDYQLKFIGFYNHVDKNMEIYRKNVTNSTVEESIEGDNTTYASSPIERPVNCVKKIQTYYKKSLNFVNQFIEVEELYQIKFIFHAVIAFSQTCSTNFIAQKQLQNVRLPSQKIQLSNNKRNISSSPSEQTPTKNPLQQARKQIYEAVKRKSLSKSHNSSNTNVIYKQLQQRTNKNRPYYQPALNRHESMMQKQSLSPARKQKKYLEDQNSNDVKQFRQVGKRSYVYLTEDREEKNNQLKQMMKEMPKKYQYTREGQLKMQPQKQSLNKFVYLEKDRANINKKVQNLKTLTDYYEEIQNKLRKETPRKSKSPIKFIQNSSNKYRNSISPRSSQYTNKSRKTPEKYNYNDIPNAPLGSRKVLKYG